MKYNIQEPDLVMSTCLPLYCIYAECHIDECHGAKQTGQKQMKLLAYYIITVSKEAEALGHD